jgi:hypothetical protein
MHQLGPAIFFWAIALLQLIVAAVPKWQSKARWGRHGKGPPISVAGVRLFALFFAVFGLEFYLGDPGRFLNYLLAGIQLATLLALAYVGLRDRRKFRAK